MRRAILAILLIAFLTSLGLFGSEVTDKINNATVRVFFTTTFTDVYGNEITQMSQGTGTVVSKERIVSAYHLGVDKPVGVFYGFVPFFNKKGELATKKVALSIEKYDAYEDVLILKMEKLEGVVTVKVAKQYPEVGELIFFAGYNAMQMPKIRSDLFSQGHNEGAFYHPVFFGDSGGGVFNKEGELIGVTKVMHVLNGNVFTLVGKAARLEVIQELLK